MIQSWNGSGADRWRWGWLDWTHARQLVRVQRTTIDPRTGETKLGNRYYVADQTTDELGARSALTIARTHWRCENETHQTADAKLQEYRRRLAWSRHPREVLVVSALRMMALMILAVTPLPSRQGYSKERPRWSQVIQHFFLLLCDSILDTEAFDTVWARPGVGLLQASVVGALLARGLGELRRRPGRGAHAGPAAAGRAPGQAVGDPSWGSRAATLTDATGSR